MTQIFLFSMGGGGGGLSWRQKGSSKSTIIQEDKMSSPCDLRCPCDVSGQECNEKEVTTEYQNRMGREVLILGERIVNCAVSSKAYLEVNILRSYLDDSSLSFPKMGVSH